MANTVTVATGLVGAGPLTLVASAVDSVTYVDRWTQIQVTSKDGLAEVWFTTDGSTPTLGGSNCYRLPAVVEATCLAPVPPTWPSLPTVVKLISSGTPTYIVAHF